MPPARFHWFIHIGIKKSSTAIRFRLIKAWRKGAGGEPLYKCAGSHDGRCLLQKHLQDVFAGGSRAGGMVLLDLHVQCASMSWPQRVASIPISYLAAFSCPYTP